MTAEAVTAHLYWQHPWDGEPACTIPGGCDAKPGEACADWCPEVTGEATTPFDDEEERR